METKIFMLILLMYLPFNESIPIPWFFKSANVKYPPAEQVINNLKTELLTPSKQADTISLNQTPNSYPKTKLDSEIQNDSRKNLIDKEPKAAIIKSSSKLVQDAHSLSETTISNTKKGVFELNQGITILKDLDKLTKHRQMLQKYQNIMKYLKLNTYLNQFRKIEKPNIIKIQDIKDINNHLLIKGVKIEGEILDEFYEILSVSDKKYAMIKVNPEIYDKLLDFKDKNFEAYSSLLEIVKFKLPSNEVPRRSLILSVQRNQIYKLENWFSKVESISKQLELNPEVVRRSGNILGIDKLFPSFKDAKVYETKKEIELLKNKPDLLKALEDYLGDEEFKSRIKRINTFHEITSQIVSTEQISAWLAQNLDVIRMIKIINHIERNFKDGKMLDLSTQFKNEDEFKLVKQWFYPILNKRTSTNVKIENEEIINLSKEIKSSYSEISKALHTTSWSDIKQKPIEISEEKIKSQTKLLKLPVKPLKSDSKQMTGWKKKFKIIFSSFIKKIKNWFKNRFHSK